MKIQDLIRDNIKALKPYSSARDEYKDASSNMVFLDANENPYNNGVNRYPDPQQSNLKNVLAQQKGISKDNILLGNGSDEVLDLILRVFCEPNKDKIITLPPTYGMYEVLANVNAVDVIKINLSESFQPKVDDILNSTDQYSKILFLSSPNNPSGNSFNIKNVERLLNNYQGLVVVDEAYIDFSDDPGFSSEILKYPNLVVLQTFSKARAMAGIRLGMALMNTAIVQILNKIKYPYNISLLNQKAGLKALEDESVIPGIKAILDQRTWLITELKKLTIIEKIWPSDANFLLVKFKKCMEVFQFLKKEGIIVRNRSNAPNCKGCLRISVGTSLENRVLINTLKQFQQKKKLSYKKNIIS